MRIKIIRNIDDSTVYCSSQFGFLKFNWKGDTPIVNKEYDVELDINGVLVWNKDILAIQNECYSIEITEKIIYLHGLIEAIDDDGYTVFRIGDDLIAFMTKGIAFNIGSYVRICVDSVEAYDTNYI